MGIKIKRIFSILTILILTSLVLTSSLPSYGEYGEYVRVGLTDTKFNNLFKQEVIVYGTADCDICDKETRKIILHVPANEDILIKNAENGLNVTVNNKTENLRDIVILCQTGLLGVRNVTRKGKPAIYHGVFEVLQAECKHGFYLVNNVELQEYLKGVVPNEMPVKFGLEALKAQAVAARNYVLAPRTHAYKEFSVVDSVASQVYYGANTETDLSTRAVMETDGIVALHNNEIILALYSSTAGGYTENYSNAFSDVTTKMFPSINKPYLVATPDKEEFKPLYSEEDAREFYMQKVPSYDVESPYYRWKRSWTTGELENILKKTLISQSKTGFIMPAFRDGDTLGRIKDIKVMKRGASGKIIELDLMTSKGCYRISKELVIRRVFQKDGNSLPSANAVFTLQTDSYGNVTSIIADGGGYGHGVGMSQYGAGYMATRLKQPYYNILRHYYKDISLGTKPAIIYAGPVKQTFWAPIGRAQIVLYGNYIPQLNVIINGKKYEITINQSLFHKGTRIDISRYIEDGANIIEYLPTKFPVKMYVEVVEKYNIGNFSESNTTESEN